MKDKIKQEILDLYEDSESDPDFDEVVDLVFDKTTEAFIEEIRKELKNEFTNGNLKHNFIISSDYYLDLKLKEIRERFSQLGIEISSESIDIE